MDAVLDATQAFFDRLSEVDFAPLALAIVVHLLKTVCTSRAWFNTLRAAYPETRFHWRSIYGAYIAGVGFNAVMPIRGGDVVKLGLAHRAIDGATYTTLAATFLVLAIVDSVMGLMFFGYALTQDVLPSLDVLPNLPSFDYGWFFAHGRTSLALIVVIAVLVTIAAVWIHGRVREFKARVRQGVTVLRDRRRYFLGVAFWQLCDWTLRLVAISLFLRAFDIEPTLRNVLLVQVTQSLATLVPVSPAGIGTEQAFIVYVFRGTVSGSKLLAFSVGMKLTLVVTNVIVGFTALALILRTLKVGSWLRRKRGDEAPAET
jgi:uncharacterized membrane protein YbhN (UPF0104 family)